jgi:diamine N-acetyltransferase
MNPNPLECRFRPAESAYIENLVALCRELYVHDGTPFHEERHRPAIAELIAHPDWGRIFIIEVISEIAGYMVFTLGYSLEFAGRDAFLDELYLREPFRGRGIGTQATDYLCSFAKSLGIRAIHLEVERANTLAQEFYRKHDFKDHERYLMTRWL